MKKVLAVAAITATMLAVGTGAYTGEVLSTATDVVAAAAMAASRAKKKV